MPPVVVIAAGMVGIALLLLIWSVFGGASEAQIQTLSNLQRGMEKERDAEATSGGGAGALLNALARRCTPTGSVQRLERLLSRAGRPAEWPVDRLLAAKVVLPFVFGALGLLYIVSSPGPLAIMVTVLAVVVAYFLPELLLYSRGQERSQQIGLELADTLDQMTIAVEAGLGFDSAIARAGNNGKGPLAEELIRTLQDIQLGQSRRQAYEALAARTDAPDLRRFIRAIVQADMYGVSIAGVLRTQAAEMRMKRRQRAEEKAMQIPVKVIFPLMLCILPVLFIVLLGPAAMDIVKAFS
ncbi:type II secretion system F family protein [Cumulibacter manganitolerans]|uniref:type II secretion system F family protein n=1 Tax=Cumulibacter manganitolerans TaxID=1884992 RepID=UPI001295BD1C|nr:type II secretion system F family protein [Cumulibacter manganitolerans]